MLKKELRIKYLAKRHEMSEFEINLKSRSVLDLLSANFNLSDKIVSLFLPIKYKNELNTYLILESVLNQKSIVGIPKTKFKTSEMMHFQYEDVSQIVLNEYNIPEPFFGNIILQDDGLGNLLQGSLKVGDVIYEHGIIIITNSGITGSSDGYGYVQYGSTLYGGGDYNFINNFYNNPLICSFESTVTIYETQYKCTIRENEFNFSNNPSLLSGSVAISNGSGSSFPQPGSGKLNDNVTGSYFSPYITTVGLYNNNKELLAVAKLAQPLPVSSVTDTSILINFDF